ncbi:MAG: Maf family protein [Dethiobacteria bacterium]|nr:Maf family protein [Dethiobacteria bacterium]
MTLILASESPRRAELLRQVAIPFRIVAPAVSEELSGRPSPEEMVAQLALRKAQAVSDRLPDGYVLGADTVVLHGETVLGKPVDSDDAARMLRLLSGGRHSVLTGLALVNAATGDLLERFSLTQVWVKTLADSEIRAYIATGEPFDKAGAYGIQGKGALLVEKIEGCYFNVVGLPLSLLNEMIAEMNIPTWLSRKGG